MAETNYIDTGVTFDPTVGLYAPETADIRETVAQRFRDAFHEDGKPDLDTDPTTPAGQLVDAWVAEIQAKNSEVLFLGNQFNPRVAEGRWQEALGQVYFLDRKADEPTVVTCQLTGLYGTVIPQWAIVQNTDGYQLQCQRSVTIGEDGTAEAIFETADTGEIEIPAHTVTSIVTTIPGWDTVDNEAAGATGRVVESRAEFESRRYASVANNAHGSAASVYGTVANLDGVIDCTVLENCGPDPVTQYGVEVGGHSIAVCVYGGEDEDIAEAIYRKKDCGCGWSGNTEISYIATEYGNALYTYLIYRPTPINFYVRVTIPADASMSEEVEAALKQNILSDFLGENDDSNNARVSLASTVYASRFFVAVMKTDGVDQVAGISIKFGDEGKWSNSVTINADEEPVMTAENIEIVREG